MGVGKVPEDVEGGRKRSSKVTMTTHKAPSHWEPQWKEAQILTKPGPRAEGGMEAKTTITTASESNVSKMIDSYESTVKLLRPC